MSEAIYSKYLLKNCAFKYSFVQVEFALYIVGEAVTSCILFISCLYLLYIKNVYFGDKEEHIDT